LEKAVLQTLLTEQQNFAELSEADVTCNGMTCKAMRELLAHRGVKMTGGKASLRERLLTMEPGYDTYF
jgi:hypothetical protein